MNRKDEIMKVFGIQEIESKDESIQKWINVNCEQKRLNVDKLESLIDVWSIAFINTLIERFKDAKSWQIIGFVECEIKENKSDEEDRFFAVEKKVIVGKSTLRKHYKEKSEDEDSIFKYEYIWQSQGISDKDYYGTIMFPINTNIFLKVAYAF